MAPEKVLDPDSVDVAERTIATNLLGPIRLIHAFAPFLTKQPQAAILNVTSGLAYVPLPITPTYTATRPQSTLSREPARTAVRDLRAGY